MLDADIVDTYIHIFIHTYIYNNLKNCCTYILKAHLFKKISIKFIWKEKYLINNCQKLTVTFFVVYIFLQNNKKYKSTLLKYL